MGQKSVENPEIEIMGAEAMSKTEQFFESNGKKIVIIIFVLMVLSAAIFSYKMLVVAPAEERAADAIYSAQLLFDAPDYQGAVEQFVAVADDYSSTKAGNLANHYAALCYIKLGDSANALKYLKQYKAQKGIPAQIINAQNLGLQGDLAVNAGDYAAAVELFKRAANISENPLTTPMYLRKAGQAADAAGNTVEAKSLFQSIVDLYPSSPENRTAEKYLGAIK
ncbi:MAG: tetratricopeptide repeat protein [Rikenellaceae bacterium]